MASAKANKASKTSTKTKATAKPKLKAVKTTESKPTVTQNTTAYTIEKNIPFVRRRVGGGKTNYPFAQMEKGDSILIASEISNDDAALYANETEHKQAQREDLKVIANRLSGATRRFVKKNGDYKFAIQAEYEPKAGVRVWRLDTEAKA